MNSRQNKEVFVFFVCITLVFLILALINQTPGILERL